MSSRCTCCLGLLLACAAILLAASCGDFPFQLRNSPPSSGSATQTAQATAPAILLSNLRVCTSDLDASAYIDQCCDDFIFVPDPLDIAALEQNYPGVFDNWTLSTERQVMRYMLDKGRCGYARIDFSDSTFLESTDTTYALQMNYKLVIMLDNKSTDYSGIGRLFMRKRTSDNLWCLRRWEDIKVRDVQQDTWGLLRGQIRATTGG